MQLRTKYELRITFVCSILIKLHLPYNAIEGKAHFRSFKLVSCKISSCHSEMPLKAKCLLFFSFFFIIDPIQAKGYRASWAEHFISAYGNKAKFLLEYRKVQDYLYLCVPLLILDVCTVNIRVSRLKNNNRRLFSVFMTLTL